jgi:hypothetical protein
MGSRERKRAERRKRKERAIHNYAERSEARNVEAREELVPLEEGERPLVVTLGAIVSALISLSIVIAYAAGAEVSGDRPNISQVIAPALLTAVMAYGMWRARYWAVLGFQVVLVLLILATALGLVQAESAVQIAGNLAVLAISGTFFYFMIKALARIQMPERMPEKE